MSRHWTHRWPQDRTLSKDDRSRDVRAQHVRPANCSLRPAKTSPHLATLCLNHPVITMAGRPEPITPWIFIDYGPGLSGASWRGNAPPDEPAPITSRYDSTSLPPRCVFAAMSTSMCDVTFMTASFDDSKRTNAGHEWSFFKKIYDTVFFFFPLLSAIVRWQLIADHNE